MRVQSLNGIWEYRVGRGPWREREVPFSTRPVGHSTCRRTFRTEAGIPCVLLRFEGINYRAVAYVNGVILGEMRPWCAYTYDITEYLRQGGENELLVELDDITPVFGPSEGWENYGGIPRDVTLYLGERQYLSDVFFSSMLCEDYTAADMTVAVTAQCGTQDRVRVTLLDGAEEVLSYEHEVSAGSETHRVEDVRLWSPDDPYLYTLRTELLRGERVVDTDERAVGFRAFCVGKRRFYLNGEPIFLCGVCRHEMFGEQGHLTDPERIEEDMRQIKEMGCNYVRLVHYPHSRVTLDIADRLGLLVSEEPGLWWSDTADPENHAGSLEVLRRTILRDRSHACVAFWLCFNECRFTEKFLIESARVCRKYDPTRPVSGANCMSLEDTIKYYELCGFDFYTMHPYDSTTKRLCDSVKALRDKPLLFTEWGGYYVYDNPGLLRQFIRQMIAYWHEPDDGDVLTGACFWCYADMYEFNRRRPAARDGILTEGLVDIWRNPSMIFDVFCETWQELTDKHRPDESFEMKVVGERSDGTALPLPEQGGEVWERVMAAVTSPIARYQLNKRQRRPVFGPVLRDAIGVGIYRRPYALFDGEELVLSPGMAAERLTLFGAVSVTDAYPLTGMDRYGEVAAVVTVVYGDSFEEEFLLRNGVEVTTVYTTFGPSRIEVIGERAMPWVRFSYDKNFEDYLINRVDLELSSWGVKEIRVTPAGAGYCLLFWGMFLE